MDFVRTPDERFSDLADFPYEPQYLQVDAQDGTSLRFAYVDHGEGPAVLMLHGEPSWSYLYRKMIPQIAEAGFRCIAFDLIGFGRSDKPTNQDDYTYVAHVDWVRQAISALELKDIRLICQDWGGLIGLRIVGEEPELFHSVVAANTFLPAGHGKFPDAFFQWQKYSQSVPEFPVGGVINGGCATDLSPEVIAAYNAPFPDESFKAGARVFPRIVPTDPDDPECAVNKAAWEGLYAFEKPFLTAFSDQDPITGGMDKLFHKLVPGTQEQPHTTIIGGGHFLQEDKGEALADAILKFYAQN